MKKINKTFIVIAFFLSLFLIAPISALSATTPGLGLAASFGILSNTYTNTSAGTTINGDLGYTTGPAVTPTVNGTTHVADGTYNQAGMDQGAALAALNAQACDFNFLAATDLSLLPQPLSPGVYCITGAAVIGTGGITLSGSGTYLFRIDGALTTVANSSVTLVNGASACDVFWTPTGLTTLGANSSFAGTDIDDSGITVGNTVLWNGRALAFGGTVTTDTDTISVPTCNVTPTPTPTPTETPTPTPTPTPTVTPTPIPSPTPKPHGEIHGTKYDDHDGNGKIHEWYKHWFSHRLSGWTIYLDTNNNGALDAGERSTVTNRYGNYHFTGLVPGTYNVREVLKPGWIQTYPSTGKHVVILTPGQKVKNKDFGNFKRGSISGMKFKDKNGNHRKDYGEPGLQGWTIKLTKVGSSSFHTSTVTDASGNYSFTNLGPGTYIVREVQQSGWVQTTNNPSDIKVRSGTDSEKNNFGNHFGKVKKDKDHGYDNDYKDDDHKDNNNHYGYNK